MALVHHRHRCGKTNIFHFCISVYMNIFLLKKHSAISSSSCNETLLAPGAQTLRYDCNLCENKVALLVIKRQL